MGRKEVQQCRIRIHYDGRSQGYSTRSDLVRHGSRREVQSCRRCGCNTAETAVRCFLKVRTTRNLRRSARLTIRYRHGSLYFKSDATKGCSNVEVHGDLPSSARSAARDQFVIGPVADQAFWETPQIPLFTDRGPCEFTDTRAWDTG